MPYSFIERLELMQRLCGLIGCVKFVEVHFNHVFLKG